MTTPKVNSTSSVADQKALVEETVRVLEKLNQRFTEAFPILKTNLPFDDYSDKDVCAYEQCEQLETMKYKFLTSLLVELIGEEVSDVQ